MMMKAALLLAVQMAAGEQGLQWPADASVSTESSLQPSVLGTPLLDTSCQGVATAQHRDEEPEPVEGACGRWVLVRHWSIVGEGDRGCEAVGQQHMQRIEVRDGEAPQFTELPHRTKTVDFLTDYGPAATGVPQVSDGEGLASYPVVLGYKDAVEMQEAAAACAQGVARVTRVWTVYDACGNTRRWNQTIHISHPRAAGPGVLGRLSGYHVASPLAVVGLEAGVAGGVGAGKTAVLSNSRVLGEVATGVLGDIKVLAAQLTELSEVLRILPPLRTGPSRIQCTGNTACKVQELTAPSASRVQKNRGTGDVVATGDGDVYNVFTLDVGDWWYTANTGRRPQLTVRAKGFVFFNVRYTTFVQHDAVREIVFEAPSLGATHTLFNMKQVCPLFRFLCPKYEWHGFQHHHVDRASLNTDDPTAFAYGGIPQVFHLHNTTISGSVLIQDSLSVLTLTDVDVAGQLWSVGTAVHLNYSTFSGVTFAANTVCPSGSGCRKFSSC